MLREELVDDWGVTRAIKKIDKRASGYGLRTRRRSADARPAPDRDGAPDAHDALAMCREVLGYDRPVELYVEPEPMVPGVLRAQRVGAASSSVSARGLLETFSDAELRFVLGHEIGHAVFDHFAIPMPITATLEDVGGKFVSRPVQLKLYLWCRAAEVSGRPRRPRVRR